MFPLHVQDSPQIQSAVTISYEIAIWIYATRPFPALFFVSFSSLHSCIWNRAKMPVFLKVCLTKAEYKQFSDDHCMENGALS